MPNFVPTVATVTSSQNLDVTLVEIVRQVGVPPVIPQPVNVSTLDFSQPLNTASFAMF